MLFETERCHIDFFTLKDYPDYYSLMSSLPVMRHITGRALDHSETMDRFYLALESISRILGIGRMKVVDTDSGEFIGLLKLVPFEGNMEIGYAFKTDFWGKGYGKELCQGLVKYCSAIEHVHGLHAIVAVNNSASKKILINSGFAWTKKEMYKGELADFFYREV